MTRDFSAPIRPWLTGGVTLLLLAGLASALIEPPLSAWLRLSEIESQLQRAASRREALAGAQGPLFRPADLVFITADLEGVEALGEARLRQVLAEGPTLQLTSGGVEVASDDFGQGMTQLVLSGDMLQLERQLNTLANLAPGLRIHSLIVEDQGERAGDRLRAEMTLSWLWAGADVDAALTIDDLPGDGADLDPGAWRAPPSASGARIAWVERLPFHPRHIAYTPPAPPPAPINIELLGIASRDGTLVASLLIDGETIEVAEGDMTLAGPVVQIEIDAITLGGDAPRRLSLFGD